MNKRRTDMPVIQAAETPAGGPQAAQKIALEGFCEEVAAAHLGLDIAKLQSICKSPEDDAPAASSYSSLDVVALVELIGQIVMAIIESCPEKSPEAFVAAVTRSRFWQRVRVKRIVKDHFDCAATSDGAVSREPWPTAC